MTSVYMESLLILSYFALHHLAVMDTGHAFYSFEGLWNYKIKRYSYVNSLELKWRESHWKVERGGVFLSAPGKLFVAVWFQSMNVVSELLNFSEPPFPSL